MITVCDITWHLDLCGRFRGVCVGGGGANYGLLRYHVGYIPSNSNMFTNSQNLAMLDVVRILIKIYVPHLATYRIQWLRYVIQRGALY